MNNNTLSNYTILDAALKQASDNGRTITVELDNGWRYTGTVDSSCLTRFTLWTGYQHVTVFKDAVMFAGVN